jgi:DNA-binding NtrC family response regulator
MSRVLVIDDEESVLNAVRRRLEREGFNITTASSADEGTNLIRSEEAPFDIIVTDMSMDEPDSGLLVLNAAFGRDLFAQVIVMTAYGSVGNAVECMRRGAFDYIEKNAPGVDAYEELVKKAFLAMDQRRRDLRNVDMWERAARAVKA